MAAGQGGSGETYAARPARGVESVAASEGSGALATVTNGLPTVMTVGGGGPGWPGRAGRREREAAASLQSLGAPLRGAARLNGGRQVPAQRTRAVKSGRRGARGGGDADGAGVVTARCKRRGVQAWPPRARELTHFRGRAPRGPSPVRRCGPRSGPQRHTPPPGALPRHPPWAQGARSGAAAGFNFPSRPPPPPAPSLGRAPVPLCPIPELPPPAVAPPTGHGGCRRCQGDPATRPLRLPSRGPLPFPCGCLTSKSSPGHSHPSPRRGGLSPLAVALRRGQGGGGLLPLLGAPTAARARRGRCLARTRGWRKRGEEGQSGRPATPRRGCVSVSPRRLPLGGAAPRRVPCWPNPAVDA